jgi:hypothetical protein
MILAFQCLLCIGQGKSTTGGIFLSDVTNAESVGFLRQKVYQLNTLTHDLPFIEKMEFRTETNDFDFRKQEYVFRLSPNSLKNIKTQRQYQETVRYMTEMELEAALGNALKKRYDLLVDYIFLKDVLEIRKKQEVLLNDKVTLLKRSISLPNFNVLDLIESEDKAQKNMRDILDLENSILTIEKTIQRMQGSNEPIEIDEDKLTDIADLKRILSGLSPVVDSKHPELEVYSARLYNQMLEYEWESARTRFSVGYLQAKYGYDPNDNFKNSFSIGVGFDIPLKSSSRLDLNDLQLQVLESESRFKNLKEELRDESYSAYNRLQNLISKYELVLSQLEEGQAEYALKEYRKIAEASPKALLTMRENTLNLELLAKELQFEIMQSFIKYLDAKGLISQRPFINYLSKDLEQL